MSTVLGAIILFLLLIVPGFIAENLFHFISRCRQRSIVIGALIFDLFIFLINITGLYWFNNVKTVEDLYTHFNCLHFSRLYGILSIFLAILLGVTFGIIGKFVCRICRTTD